MLTDQQLTETTLRLIAAELDHLARYDRTEQIGELLCEHHCTTPECSHNPAETVEEMRAVHQKIKDFVAVLRGELSSHATARGIALPEPGHR